MSPAAVIAWRRGRCGPARSPGPDSHPYFSMLAPSQIAYRCQLPPRAGVACGCPGAGRTPVVGIDRAACCSQHQAGCRLVFAWVAGMDVPPAGCVWRRLVGRRTLARLEEKGTR